MRAASLPSPTPPTLPFLLDRPGSAAASTCAAYTVTCIPGTQPARGLLQRAPPGTSLAPRDFCRTGAHTASSWLPPHVGEGASAVSQASRCHPCPTSSLLPRHGLDVHPLASCDAGASYSVLQCSERSLVPGGGAASGAVGGAAEGVDVLLAITDNVGHGLFAIVERVVNQVLFALTRGLEPVVSLPMHPPCLSRPRLAGPIRAHARPRAGRLSRRARLC